MARPGRIDFPDGLYHVTSRGNGRQKLFWTNDDRQWFLGQLADGVQSAAIVLYAFALMDIHEHLLVRTPRANLLGEKMVRNDFCDDVSVLCFSKWQSWTILNGNSAAA